MKKKIINALELAVLAILILAIGNASRQYSAFGGEDMVAIVLFLSAIYQFLPKAEDQKDV